MRYKHKIKRLKELPPMYDVVTSESSIREDIEHLIARYAFMSKKLDEQLDLEYKDMSFHTIWNYTPAKTAFKLRDYD